MPPSPAAPAAPPPPRPKGGKAPLAAERALVGVEAAVSTSPSPASNVHGREDERVLVRRHAIMVGRAVVLPIWAAICWAATELPSHAEPIKAPSVPHPPAAWPPCPALSPGRPPYQHCKEWRAAGGSRLSGPAPQHAMSMAAWQVTPAVTRVLTEVTPCCLPCALPRSKPAATGWKANARRGTGITCGCVVWRGRCCCRQQPRSGAGLTAAFGGWAAVRGRRLQWREREGQQRCNPQHTHCHLQLRFECSQATIENCWPSWWAKGNCSQCSVPQQCCRWTAGLHTWHAACASTETHTNFLCTTEPPASMACAAPPGRHKKQ